MARQLHADIRSSARSVPSHAIRLTLNNVLRAVSRYPNQRGEKQLPLTLTRKLGDYLLICNQPNHYPATVIR
jgi:hypothetical protein